MRVGELLREKIQEAGRVQASVSRATKISEKHLTRVINGQARLSVQIAMRLELEIPSISAEELLIAQVRDEIADYVKYRMRRENP